MPCVSAIRSTKMNRMDQLIKAAEALKLEVYKSSDNAVSIDGMNFSRNRDGQAFSVSGDTSKLIALQRKYAEVGVREFAKQRGYSIVMKDEKLVVTNRRG